MRFLSKCHHIHVFCKHPSKLDIKSDDDISDGAFYRTSSNFIYT